MIKPSFWDIFLCKTLRNRLVSIKRLISLNTEHLKIALAHLSRYKNQSPSELRAPAVYSVIRLWAKSAGAAAR